MAVEEHSDGKIYYNHILPDRTHFQEGAQAESHFKAGGLRADGTPEAPAARSNPASSRPPDSSLEPRADDLNIDIAPK